MHYKTILQVVEFIRDIPYEDLVAILAKPSTADRGEDQRWRRTCAAHGVSTTPLGAAKDTAAYMRGYRAAASLDEARARMADLEADVRKLQTECARLRVENARLAGMEK